MGAADETGYCATHRKAREKDGRLGGRPPIHAVYSHRMSAEEVARMPELADTIGTLDGEILVAKIQLDRALAEWQRWQVGNVDANDLLDTECGSSSATGSGETVVHSQKDEMQLRSALQFW